MHACACAQHCIKLELETALEDAKAVMAQVASAAMIGNMVGSHDGILSWGPD
jgi:hypothetical protein